MTLPTSCTLLYNIFFNYIIWFCRDYFQGYFFPETYLYFTFFTKIGSIRHLFKKLTLIDLL